MKKLPTMYPLIAAAESTDTRRAAGRRRCGMSGNRPEPIADDCVRSRKAVTKMVTNASRPSSTLRAMLTLDSLIWRAHLVSSSWWSWTTSTRLRRLTMCPIGPVPRAASSTVPGRSPATWMIWLRIGMTNRAIIPITESAETNITMAVATPR